MTVTLRCIHLLLVASALSLLTVIGCAPTDDAPAPFAWAEATDSLTIVGEDTVSRTGANVYGTAYTPGGDTLFFHTTDRGDGQSGIAMTTRTDTGWTAPRPAPFETDDHDEGHPSITPDGQYVLFTSDRAGAPNNADEFYRAARASGWTDVTRMTTTERISEKRGGVASDGTMYYWTYTRGEGMGFYRGQIGPDGAIRDTVDADPLLFPDDGGENNPHIDPGKRFMLFATWGRDDGYGKEDLYLSTREGDGWSAPVNLGPAVNSAGSDTHPYVTPDGSLLFLTSSRLRSPADTSDNWNHYVIRTDAVPALREVLQ
jgi:Tol biopolymer transport system component